jgi:hypothetical protein
MVIKTVLNVILGQHNTPTAAVHTVEMTGLLKKKKQQNVYETSRIRSSTFISTTDYLVQIPTMTVIPT